jgi:hypothetical protein
MVSFSLRQRILFTSSVDTRSVSFHLSQFAEMKSQLKVLAEDPDLPDNARRAVRECLAR